MRDGQAGLGHPVGGGRLESGVEGVFKKGSELRLDASAN